MRTRTTHTHGCVTVCACLCDVLEQRDESHLRPCMAAPEAASQAARSCSSAASLSRLACARVRRAKCASREPSAASVARASPSVCGAATRSAVTTSAVLVAPRCGCGGGLAQCAPTLASFFAALVSGPYAHAWTTQKSTCPLERSLKGKPWRKMPPDEERCLAFFFVC